MTFLIGVLGLLFTAGLAAVAALMVRRLLGVAIGWPRSVVVGFVMASLGYAFVLEVMRRSGIGDAASMEQDIVGAVLIMGLAFAWVFVLGVLVLVVLELFVPTGSLPHPLAAFRGWRQRRRRTRRYLEVSTIAARHGLGAVLGAPFRASAEETRGRALRETLADSGVTFVKVGQLMSTRPDVVPPDIVRELSTLQADVPALPWDQIEPAVADALGRDPADLFSHISPEPLAAASVAQVHAARLRTGEDVVLKVQRPGARAQVTADLDILDRFAARLDRSAEWARAIGIRDLVDGFATSLLEELDYRVEAENMRVVARAIPHDARGHVVVPRVFDGLSSERLLVMERLRGVPLGSASTAIAALDAQARRDLATGLVRDVLRQVLVLGVFHADLHPGNVLLLEDGRLGLLDFGSVGRLDPTSRDSITLLFSAFARQDGAGATDALLDLLERPEHLDDRQVAREVGQVVMYATSGAASGASGVFAQLLRVVQRAHLGVPPQVAAAFRAFAALEGTLGLLDPDLPLVQVATSVGRDVLGAKFGPASIRTTIESQLASYLPLLHRLPRRVDRLTDDLASGRFSTNVRVLADPGDRRFVTSLVQHIVVALLAGAASVGAILLLVADAGPFLVPGVRLYTFYGYGLLLGGFVLALRALAGVVRREP